MTAERFEPGLTLNPRVSRSALVRVRMASYSVPARLIGRPVRVSLRASEVIIFDGRTEIARHPRVVAVHGQSVNLDHYLEVLQHKPGALPGSTALAHARASGVFTSAHEAFWAVARKTDGDTGGTKALIDVLLLHRSMTTEDVIAGITAALTVGAVTARGENSGSGVSDGLWWTAAVIAALTAVGVTLLATRRRKRSTSPETP